MIDRHTLEGIEQRERYRADVAREYAQGLAAGRYGPLFVARKEAEAKRAVISAVPDSPDPNWGKDAKGRKTWIGPTDADGNPLVEGGL